MAYKNTKTSGRKRYKSRYQSPHNYKTKRKPSDNGAAIVVAVATFFVIAALVVIFAFGENIYTYLENAFTSTPSQITPAAISAETYEPTVSPTEKETEAPTEKATEAPQPEEFERLVKAAGLDISKLEQSQMIFVESSGTDAKVYTYELGADGVWSQKFDPVSGYVGESGISDSIGPNDTSLTPKGTYDIEYAFGTNYDPSTPLEYYQVDYWTRWVTDPDSVNYNLLVDSDTINQNFDSCLWLYEYTVSYPYAVVFDYNRDPVKSDQGCAKFLHVSYAPTANGGVGIDIDNLVLIMQWLKPDSATISIF